MAGGGETYPAARISGECWGTAEPSFIKAPIVDSEECGAAVVPVRYGGAVYDIVGALCNLGHGTTVLLVRS